MTLNKSQSFQRSRRNFPIGLALGLLTITLLTSYTNGQGIKTPTDVDVKSANAAADIFFDRYRKTLDVAKILDDMGSKTTLIGLRKSHFFYDYGIDNKFADTFDDETLYRVYKSTMNAYFVGALHNVFISDETETVPKDVKAAIDKSSVGKPYMDWYLTDKSEGRPLIKSQQELTEYLRLCLEITMLMQKHIPRNPFESPAYLKEFEGNRKSLRMASENYGDDFGLKHGTPVYFVRRDFFNLFFIKEKNQMKLLFLGTGD